MQYIYVVYDEENATNLYAFISLQDAEKYISGCPKTVKANLYVDRVKLLVLDHEPK